MPNIKPLPPEKSKEFEFLFQLAANQMGFVPRSLKTLAHKPSILGSFVQLAGTIKGHSGKTASLWSIAKLFWANIKWGLRAKKQAHTEISPYLKAFIGHVTSNAAGCKYCQAHTALEAHELGVSAEKIAALWNFETSVLFNDAERAALSLAFAAGLMPNASTPQHFEELKKYYTTAQIVEIVSVIAMFGFLNRWNETMSTKLEPEPMAFAQQHLTGNGWTAGKHIQQ